MVYVNASCVVTARPTNVRNSDSNDRCNWLIPKVLTFSLRNRMGDAVCNPSLSSNILICPVTVWTRWCKYKPITGYDSYCWAICLDRHNQRVVISNDNLCRLSIQGNRCRDICIEGLSHSGDGNSSRGRLSVQNYFLSLHKCLI